MFILIISLEGLVQKLKKKSNRNCRESSLEPENDRKTYEISREINPLKSG